MMHACYLNLSLLGLRELESMNGEMDTSSDLNNPRSWHLIPEQILLIFSQTQCRVVILSDAA